MSATPRLDAVAKALGVGAPPSPNRKEYPFVGSLVFQGIPVDIEQKKGDTRKGVDKDGHEWAIKMHAHYGEVRASKKTIGGKGVDGDRPDVYLGDDENAREVYVIHQNDPTTGKYDEDKCFLGFASKDEALACYRKQYDRPGFYGGCTTMSVDRFKAKLADKGQAGEKLTKAKPVYVVTEHCEPAHAGKRVHLYEHPTTGHIHFREVGAHSTRVASYPPQALHITAHGVIEKPTGALLAVAEDADSHLDKAVKRLMQHEMGAGSLPSPSEAAPKPVQHNDPAGSPVHMRDSFGGVTHGTLVPHEDPDLAKVKVHEGGDSYHLPLWQSEWFHGHPHSAGPTTDVSHHDVHAAVSGGVGRLPKPSLDAEAHAYSPHPYMQDDSNHAPHHEVEALYSKLPSKGLHDLAHHMHQGEGPTTRSGTHAHGFDDATLRRMAGIPDGWHASMNGKHTPDGAHHIAIAANGSGADKGGTASRSLRIDPKTRHVEAMNEEFYAPPGKAGGGHGLKMLMTQAHELSQHKPGGHVETYAAGSADSPDFNGYYTWPHLGYTSQDPNEKVGPHGETISHLLSTKGGSAWWRKNGRGGSMAFDPKPGSYSMRRLEHYARHRLAPETVEKGGPVKDDGEHAHIDRAMDALVKKLDQHRHAHGVTTPEERRATAKAPEAEPMKKAHGPEHAMAARFLTQSKLREAINRTHTLAMKTQRFHWNVDGPDFPQLHKLFGDQYDELGEAVDELAERYKAIGPGEIRAIEIPSFDDPKSAAAMCSILATDHLTCAMICNALARRAEAAGDAGTVDLAGKRAAAHEKAAWMLRAIAHPEDKPAARATTIGEAHDWIHSRVPSGGNP